MLLVPRAKNRITAIQIDATKLGESNRSNRRGFELICVNTDSKP
jgi:hypothetical protein